MEGFHLPQRKISLQKQPSKAFERKMFLAISQKLQESTCARVSFFNKIAGFSLWKERSWHRCFHVTFVKFLRTPFLQNTSGRLLLSLWEDRTFHYKIPFSLNFINNPTVGQISEKDVQCFLRSFVSILNSERELLFIF